MAAVPLRAPPAAFTRRYLEQNVKRKDGRGWEGGGCKNKHTPESLVLFRCFRGSLVGNLQVRFCWLTSRWLHSLPLLPLLLSACSVRGGQQGNLSLSYSDTDANILYMRVLILDRPVPMPALSLLFLAGEWDMSFA